MFLRFAVHRVELIWRVREATATVWKKVHLLEYDSTKTKTANIVGRRAIYPVAGINKRDNCPKRKTGISRIQRQYFHPRHAGRCSNCAGDHVEVKRDKVAYKSRGWGDSAGKSSAIGRSHEFVARMLLYF